MAMKKTIITLPILMFIFFPISVLAQESPVERAQSRDESIENRQEIQEQREENLSLRCENAINRIDGIIERYNTNKLGYLNKYNALFARLNNLNNYLIENGIDTLDLQGYLDELNVLVLNFNTGIEATILQLEESKNYVCGESNGEYLRIVSQSKSSLLEARQDAIEINKFFLIEIVPELREIKSNIRNNNL